MPTDSIYTEIVAEHSRSAHNRRHLAHPTTVLRGVNPSCGDDITLELCEKDGIIEEAAFTGEGCAISQASTSMMIDLIKGKPVAEAMKLTDLFLAMIRGNVTNEAELEKLEDAMALQGIAHMPARVKCAVLSWRTLEDACGHTHKDG